MGKFLKGHLVSEETRKKISIANKGKVGNVGVKHPYFGKPTLNPMYGRKHSLETKAKISITSKGRWFGRTHKEESKLKCQASHKRLVSLGIHPSWRGGKTSEIKMLRTSKLYRDWRKAVFERDNYTCKLCMTKGGYLEADHRRPFSLFPHLRFTLDNGRTLCKECHKRKTGMDSLIMRKKINIDLMLLASPDLDKFARLNQI